MALTSFQARREALDVQPTASPTGGPMSGVRTSEGLHSLKQEWRELYDHCAYPSPFSSWEWACHWWHHFAPRQPSGKRPMALRVMKCYGTDGLLIAIVPLYFRSTADSPLLSREFRLLGDDGRDGEGMTDEPILLVRQGREREAVRLFVSHLHGELGDGQWDFLKVRLPLYSTGSSPQGFPSSVPADELLSEALGRGQGAGIFGKVIRDEGSQIVPLPASWPAFRQTLSKSLRDNLSYYPRRLARHGHTWQIRLIRDPAEVRQAVDFLVDLHRERARSSKGVGHISHIPEEKHAAFLRDCLPALAAQGMAFIALLEINGEVAAAQILLESRRGGPGHESRGEVVFYYSGYREQWSDYSPVTLLGAAVIEEAIGRGIGGLNFLPGPMTWKARWGSRSWGTIGELRLLCPTVGAMTRICLRSALRQAARRFTNTSSRRNPAGAVLSLRGRSGDRA